MAEESTDNGNVTRSEAEDSSEVVTNNIKTERKPIENKRFHRQ